jgi:hypothetical protein
MAGLNDELISNSSTPYAATASLNSSTATALGASTQNLTELIIQADPRNTDSILIGTASVQCWVLEAGDWMSWPIRNPALIYGKSVSGTQAANIVGRSGV